MNKILKILKKGYNMKILQNQDNDLLNSGDEDDEDDDGCGC